jgi:hypothetical protein
MTTTPFEVAAVLRALFWPGATEVEFTSLPGFSSYGFRPAAFRTRAALLLPIIWTLHRVFGHSNPPIILISALFRRSPSNSAAMKTHF